MTERTKDDVFSRYEWMPEEVRGQLRRFWTQMGRSPAEWEAYVQSSVPGGLQSVGARRSIADFSGQVATGLFIPMWNNIARVVTDDGEVVAGGFHQTRGRVPVMTLRQWALLGKELFGRDESRWLFRCPRCRRIQSARQLQIEDPSCSELEARRSAPVRCRPPKGCGWSLGGLLLLHRQEVEMEDGSISPVFEYGVEDS